MNIRNARQVDIRQIEEIEREVEGMNAATVETLISRLRMFPQGFYVAEDSGAVTGYIESCLWNRNIFNSFDEIRDFPALHDANGKTLHIIFLAVKKSQRSNGIGSGLVRTLKKYASEIGLDKVQLVSGADLVGFYEKLEFEIISKLPNFLPNINGVLMEYPLR